MDDICHCGNNIRQMMIGRHKDCLRRLCENLPVSLKWFIPILLSCCIKQKWVEGIEILLELEKKMGGPSNYGHILLHMAYNGMHTLLPLFLQSGYDVNARDDNYGSTALHAAVKGYYCISNAQSDLSEDLEIGPDPEENLKNSIEVIHLLMDYGANPSIRNKFDRTPTDILEPNDDILEYIQNHSSFQIKEPSA